MPSLCLSLRHFLPRVAFSLSPPPSLNLSLAVPGVTPGYGDEVIFADGTFVDGSTLELSADGPLRPPFNVFAQGCTHWTHWALIIEQALLDTGLVKE